MYLQEVPSTPLSNKLSRDPDETTNPDEFTQVNAHHTYRFQKTRRKLNVVHIDNHEFTGLDLVAYIGMGSCNHSPGPMEVFKTQADDKSIPNRKLCKAHFSSSMLLL